MLAPNDLLALAAATCWACGSVLSVAPARHLGAFAYTRWRMLLVGVMLWLAVLASNGWHFPLFTNSFFTISLPTHWGVMALSGAIGIFIGDTALFGAMNRLGPRRAGVLFATHAVWTALFGFAIFGERMGMQSAIGDALTIAGVMMAIVLGRRKEENHAWETDRGHVGVGVALGLLAALCQAVGTLIAKPVMTTGMDPILASAIRVSVACGAHFILLWCGVGAAQPHHRPRPRDLVQTALSGFAGMGLGMTLLLLALRQGDVGTVAVLSSVTPVLVLFLLWLVLRKAPAQGAWFGAALTVIGTALILLR